MCRPRTSRVPTLPGSDAAGIALNFRPLKSVHRVSVDDRPSEQLPATRARCYDELCARIARSEPLIREASDEVDIALLRRSMSLSPMQRLRAATRALSTQRSFKHGPPGASRLHALIGASSTRR
jgi:hypothetical protein